MAERYLVLRPHPAEDGALDMTQKQRVPQVLLDQGDEHIRLQPADVGSQDIGHQLVADDDRILALAAELALRADEPVRQGLDRLGDDGQIEPRGQILHAVMEVVGKQAELDARSARFRKPRLHIGGHRVIIARQDGVIDIAQDMREAATEQIPFDIDTGNAGKVPVRLEENRDPRPAARLRLSLADRGQMLVVGLAEVVLQHAVAIFLEVEVEVVALLGVANSLQDLEAR